ncbi:4344_t:CDS:1, partial [Rhizophagus irregularis]
DIGNYANIIFCLLAIINGIIKARKDIIRGKCEVLLDVDGGYCDGYVMR